MINSVPPRVTRSRRLPLDRYVNLLFTNYKKNDDHWIACWMSKNDGCVDSLQLEEVKTTLCKRVWGVAPGGPIPKHPAPASQAALCIALHRLPD